MGSMRITSFGGIKPNDKRGTGGPSRASVAIDAKLSRGTLDSWRYPAKEIFTSKDKICNIYSDNCCFIVSDKPCSSFAKGDTNCHRVFSTGEKAWPAFAKLPDCNTGPSGCGQVIEPVWCRLGVPAPVSAVQFNQVTVAVPRGPLSMASGDQERRESRAYIYTFVNEHGEEGPPSPVGAVRDADVNSTAMLQFSIPPLEEGYCNPQYIRIYRGGSGWNEDGEVGKSISDFFYVEDLPFTTGNFTHLDDIPAAELGEMNTSEHNTPPPANLMNLVSTDEGVLVGSEGKNIWFSEPWKYHAWTCFINLDDCVQAMVVRGDYIYAATNGYPYVISTGNNEEDCKCCRAINKIPTSAPILCKRSMVATINGAMWASTTGLIRVSGTGDITVDTHSHMTEDDWLAWFPHDIKAVYHKGTYYGFNAHRGFSWDVNDGMYSDAYLGDSGKFTELSLTPTAVLSTKQGVLYMAFGGNLNKFDAANTKMPYTWRSKLNIDGGLQNYSAMKVVFEHFLRGSIVTNPVEIQLYADGVLRFSRNVNTSQPFRLPKGYDALNWEVEISGTEAISEIHLATSMTELSLISNA